MWVRVQAVAKLPRSKPCGHSAIGVRSVSWVGVIADLTIHRSGPSPTISRKSERRRVDDAHGPADAGAAASPRPRRCRGPPGAGCGAAASGGASSRHDDVLHDRVSQK